MPALSRAWIALTALVVASGCVQAGEGARVVDVADGDTMDVKFNGSTETVRLIGLDTPETSQPVSPGEYGLENSSQNRECLSSWASRASRQAEELNGKPVRLVHGGERGYYDRLLGYIYTENSSVSFNRRMVREGYGRMYESRFSKRASFLEAQSAARAENLGVWSC